MAAGGEHEVAGAVWGDRSMQHAIQVCSVVTVFNISRGLVLVASKKFRHFSFFFCVCASFQPPHTRQRGMRAKEGGEERRSGADEHAEHALQQAREGVRLICW